MGRRGRHFGSRSPCPGHRQPGPLRYRALGGHPAFHGGFPLRCRQSRPGAAAGSRRPDEKVRILVSLLKMFDLLLNLQPLNCFCKICTKEKTFHHNSCGHKRRKWIQVDIRQVNNN